MGDGWLLCRWRSSQYSGCRRSGSHRRTGVHPGSTNGHLTGEEGGTMHNMLKEHHERVFVDPSTMAMLVALGKADPELLRMHLRAESGVVAARFDPQSQAPVMAAPFPGAVVNPLSPPTITGTTFTVDLALNNPTRVITPIIMDLTIQRFFVDRACTSAGGVTGGAVLYDNVAADLYADRDVQRVEPGSEFPEIAFSRRAPAVAAVEKWGGKFYFTDEARDRNDLAAFTNALR